MVYTYTNMTKVVNPVDWSDDNHPECNNNVACEEYKCMCPSSSTYNERNLSKELADKQVKSFINLGYIQGMVASFSKSKFREGFGYKILSIENDTLCYHAFSIWSLICFN